MVSVTFVSVVVRVPAVSDIEVVTVVDSEPVVGIASVPDSELLVADVASVAVAIPPPGQPTTKSKNEDAKLRIALHRCMPQFILRPSTGWIVECRDLDQHSRTRYL